MGAVLPGIVGGKQLDCTKTDVTGLTMYYCPTTKKYILYGM